MDLLPTLECAENHPHYMPKPRDPREGEAEKVARTINEIKVTNPQMGSTIYESLIDQLVDHTLAITAQPEHAAEPLQWTGPQRCVWRSAERLSHDRRLDLINDRTVIADVKAFASVNAGRWIVTCPFPRCNGAQMASFLDRRFFCVDCCNQAVGQRWVEVTWPESPSVTEDWLDARPEYAKNWTPGETADDIAVQDKAEMARS